MMTTYQHALARRRAVTLVEIMASILVLSIGLVGVLAAIPFGGFRLAQMNEADNSSAVGRNAQRIMKANEWFNPNNWWLKNYYANGAFYPIAGLPTDAYGVLYTSGGSNYVNLKYPFIIDPLSSDVSAAAPYVPGRVIVTPNGGYQAAFAMVSPLKEGVDGFSANSGCTLAYWNTRLTDWYQGLFYQRDDVVSGYSDDESEQEYRPSLNLGLLDAERETLYDWDTNTNTNAANSPTIASYTGRYSWMAFVHPKASDVPFYAATLADIDSASYDCVVFKDRILGDQKSMAATLVGSGYQGGVVELKLDSMRDSDNNVANGDLDRSRVVEQLELTRYIMLVGPDDYPTPLDSGALYTPSFARWYKIASYSVDEANETVRLSLIGPDAPANWANGNDPVTAVFYPGVVGVYSGSADF